jgi:murein L,D-transpeptidase YcbB/YkuD
MVCGISSIPLFYKRRNFQPAWMGHDGSYPQADSLIGALHNSNREGLRPEDYHLKSLELLLKEIRGSQTENNTSSIEKKADLDLLLTDAFLLYGAHLLAGRVNPETIHSEWIAYNPNKDLVHSLQSALNSNQIEKTLLDLRPSHPGYTRLQKTLSVYRELTRKGGWQTVSAGPALQKGDRGERVSQLFRRLLISGDHEPGDSSPPDLFTEALDASVRRFQKRNGLKQDGIVGPRTLAAMNVPAKERLRQIELNLERWRWIPRDLGNRYILVNIADFKLSVVDNDKTAISMRVVVGRNYRRTPVFSEEMIYLVLNPVWNIPQTIAVNDILPKIQTDSEYLSRQKIRVLENWRKGAPELEPQFIDWASLNEQNFSYRLQQEAGPRNALGRIKFIFPNEFAVYLHDTPQQQLFEKNIRDFSSGCIRVEKPMELARFLLKDDLHWTDEKIMETIESGDEAVIPLRAPIPVHILYWTAWVDADGLVNFRNDIYERDTPLDRALQERAPN